MRIRETFHGVYFFFFYLLSVTEMREMD